MSGQSNGGKNQSNNPFGQYGQTGQYGQPYYPGQQGSYFSNGGTSRGGFDYPSPNTGSDPFGGSGFGSYGAVGQPNPSFNWGSIFGSNTGYTPMQGNTTPGNGMAPYTTQPTQAPQTPYNPVAAQSPLSTTGLTQTQQQLGMGTTPQGTMAFRGSVAQLDPGTARMLGFTQQGGNYVNSAGQVVGRV